jgi:hypothetical protein
VSETARSAEIRAYLQMRGFILLPDHYAAWRPGLGAFWRNNTGARGRLRFGCTGTSDYLGITADGRMLAVEAKDAGGELSDEQQMFRAIVQACGGVWIEARGAEDIEAGLREAARSKATGRAS